MMSREFPPHNDAPHDAPENGIAWQHGAYKIESGSFATAMIHLYRAEVSRANVWRRRLDVTTNWAIIATGTSISFAFAQPETHHSVILLNMLLVLLFLSLEARRYRYYELWSYRTRLLETEFFAAMLVPPHAPDPAWAQRLAQTLITPQFTISIWEALGRRLRRSYVWIFLVLICAWLAKLLLYPAPPVDIAQLIQRAGISVIDGGLVMLLAVLFSVGVILISLLTARLRHAGGEVLRRADAGGRFAALDEAD